MEVFLRRNFQRQTTVREEITLAFSDGPNVGEKTGKPVCAKTTTEARLSSVQLCNAAFMMLHCSVE